eukprot:CAMPEP_0183373104 /NCGR_PEP_ID=MMETSP0164_2-20130417/110401_1 /TAXON_ID=221442 /ORGANISM="Coccolithus pelagicus ssp braarudi, Strain PLY182g" /LENGTH=74 /DNA_ID=CAMNT_0025549919 /DNA_START=9 /DNA_END=230 /DNA_ORIENTATION=+
MNILTPSLSRIPFPHSILTSNLTRRAPASRAAASQRQTAAWPQRRPCLPARPLVPAGRAAAAEAAEAAALAAAA